MFIQIAPKQIECVEFICYAVSLEQPSTELFIHLTISAILKIPDNLPVQSCCYPGKPGRKNCDKLQKQTEKRPRLVSMQISLERTGCKERAEINTQTAT